MLSRIFAAAVLGLAMTQVAPAQPGTKPSTGANPGTQSGPPPSSTTPSSPGTQQDSTQAQHESLPQELRQRLSDAGYTDIQIVPRSFVVSAKTKEGNPVLMRISPNEMTVLTEAPADRTNAGNAPATTGSTGTAGTTGETTGDRFSHPSGLPQGSGSQK